MSYIGILCIGIICFSIALYIAYPNSQTGGDSDVSGKDETCACKNPYSEVEITNLIKEGVNNLPPHTLKLLSSYSGTKDLISPSIREKLKRDEDPHLPTGAHVEIIAEPKPIQVHTVSTGSVTLCEALQKVGFNPNWTMDDIEALQKTKAGRDILYGMHTSLVKLTGLKHITNRDIMACYPQFYTDYVCLRDKHVTSEAAASTQVPAQRIPLAVQAAPHCNNNAIKKDLTKSIALHFNQDASDETRKQQILATAHYLKIRADLEIRSLINLFQSKSKKDWLTYLSGKKQQEPKGYHLDGTTYYIPWYIFDKYAICFGWN